MGIGNAVAKTKYSMLLGGKLTEPKDAMYRLASKCSIVPVFENNHYVLTDNVDKNK